MKRPSILSNIAVAAVMTLGTLPLGFVLRHLTTENSVFQLTPLLLTIAYIGSLLASSAKRVGKITLGAFCLTALSIAYLLKLPLIGMLFICAGLIWMTRSWLHYSGILPVIADLGLCLTGLAFALWAFFIGGSLAAAIWCFFLTQALSALIPVRIAAEPVVDEPFGADRFYQAYQSAETAIKRLARR